jgi:hypothetical protein
MSQYPPDFTPSEIAIVERVANFTMTSVERIHALIHAVRHIVRNRIEGDLVECGVWRGGSMMTIALTLLEMQAANAGPTNGLLRHLYLFDTFEGMPPPADVDVSYQGIPAAASMNEPIVRAWAGLEDVVAAITSTGYPMELVHFIQGRVEETIPKDLTGQIALLRLDTDWYESTRHELRYLYPLLARNGILIIDDYGHWQGARRAVDEYFQNGGPFLNRIDYTGRLAVKP